MSNVKCFYCGNQIKLNSEVCPSCKAWVKPFSSGSANSPISTVTDNQKKLPSIKDVGEKYFWLFNLCGGIFLIISAVTPTAYITFFGSTYVWMFGIISSSNGTFQPIGDTTVLVVGIIMFIILLLSGILTILTTYGEKVEKIDKSQDELVKIWAGLAVISIIITIVYISVFGAGSYYMGWAFFNATFGVVGPFIGSGIIISGIAIRDKYF